MAIKVFFFLIIIINVHVCACVCACACGWAGGTAHITCNYLVVNASKDYIANNEPLSHMANQASN